MTIKEFRIKTGMSQSIFAKHFGLSVRSVQEWEQERKKPPTYLTDLLIRIYVLERQNDNPSDVIAEAPPDKGEKYNEKKQ